MGMTGGGAARMTSENGVKKRGATRPPDKV